MLYGVHCEKCYSLREVERNDIILRDENDIPAYTLSAEVICQSKKSYQIKRTW